MPVLTLTDPVNATPTDANLIANNNTQIKSVVNALTNTNIDAAAGISVSKLAAGADGQVLTTTGGVTVWGSGVPIGAVMMWVTAVAPTGWQLCDGSSQLRAGTFNPLFLVIGTTYGSVDGTHFNVPDLKGRVAVGSGTNVALGASDGVTEANRRGTKHRHTAHSHGPGTLVPSVVNSAGSAKISLGDGTLDAIARGQQVTLGDFGGFRAQTMSGATAAVDGGSGTAADPLDGAAFVAVNYIIKI